MKRAIATLLVIALVFPMASISTRAAENDITAESCSYINENGDVITIVSSVDSGCSIVELYQNGFLLQKAAANANTMTVYTEIYDLEKSQSGMRSAAMPTEVYETNGFMATIVHKDVSDTRINPAMQIAPAAIINPSIRDEPRDNTGLPLSVYGDGYHFLGSSGGYQERPEIGYVFRKCVSTYAGQQKYWTFQVGEAVSLVLSIIGAFVPPISKLAIVSLLVTAGNVIASYSQSVSLDVYDFDYDYRIRVNNTVYFEASRNVSYWKLYNVTTGAQEWEYKGINYGYYQDCLVMIQVAIDRYRYGY